MRKAQNSKQAGHTASEVVVHHSAYIPHACHYDDKTLLTRNGELMQTIRISGYEYESFRDGVKISLRDDIRKAFADAALAPHFSVSFHVVRRQADISLPGDFTSGFARDLDAAWTRDRQWANGYINDLYITVIHEGAAFPLWSIGQVSRSLFLRAEKFFQKRYLDKASKALEEAVDQMLAALAHYNPHRLALVDKEEVIYSEPIGFLNALVNLETAAPLPVPVCDIADYITRQPIEFDYNTLEVRHADGRVRHASIFSIKQYSEILPSVVDRFLQYPGEIIITHQVMLGAPKQFVRDAEYKKYIAMLGDDKEFVTLSGVDDILQSNMGTPMDYSLQQTTITVLADSPGQLEAMVQDMMKRLGSTGIAAVREDIMMEDMFFSHLPGNFNFLRRKQPVSTRQIAGYATLYDFPAGKRIGNHWGPAAAILPSAAKNPYFFSFHEGDGGHTMIAGPHGCGKNLLLHFLMTQAMRFHPRLFLIDSLRSGEMLIRALGGKYIRFTRDKGVKMPKLNPLQLADTPANRAFLEEWLAYLFYDLDGNLPASGGSGVRAYISAMVTWVMNQPPERRRLSEMAAQMAELPEELRKYYTQWIGDGRYGHLFDNEVDEWPADAPVMGVDITEMVQDRRPQWAVLSYLMHRYMESLSSAPGICVLDEAWVLLDNPVFGPKVSQWLDTLRQRNVAAILATDQIEEMVQGEITPLVVMKTATRILFPDSNATEAYQTQFGLTEAEYKHFTAMEKERKQCFIRHGQESVVVELQLPENRGMMEVLKGSPNMVTRMENIISQAGENPEQWLPLFYQQVVGGNAT